MRSAIACEMLTKLINKKEDKAMKLKTKRLRRGQGLIEFVTVVAAVGFIGLVSVSVFGHKVADQYAICAGMLPAACDEDQVPIATGGFAGTTVNIDGAIQGNGSVSWSSVTGNADGDGELENNIVANGGTADGEAFVAD